MLSLENGQVQCWSDHPAGGYQGSFQGIHTAGDYVSAFATDVHNHYLFSGTTVGYIKVWLMTNYLTTEKVCFKTYFIITALFLLIRFIISFSRTRPGSGPDTRLFNDLIIS